MVLSALHILGTFNPLQAYEVGIIFVLILYSNTLIYKVRLIT